MNKENEILDENFREETTKPKKKVTYLKYSIIYIILMILIGSLLTNLLIDQNLNIYQLLVGASTYFIMGISISIVIELIKSLYRNITGNRKNNNSNPIWYNILENGFYFWSVIVVVITFVGNFLI